MSPCQVRGGEGERETRARLAQILRRKPLTATHPATLPWGRTAWIPPTEKRTAAHWQAGEWAGARIITHSGWAKIKQAKRTRFVGL